MLLLLPIHDTGFVKRAKTPLPLNSG